MPIDLSGGKGQIVVRNNKFLINTPVDNCGNVLEAIELSSNNVIVNNNLEVIGNISNAILDASLNILDTSLSSLISYINTLGGNFGGNSFDNSYASLGQDASFGNVDISGNLNNMLVFDSFNNRINPVSPYNNGSIDLGYKNNSNDRARFNNIHTKKLICNSTQINEDIRFYISGITDDTTRLQTSTSGTNGGNFEIQTKVDGGSLTEKLRVNNIGAIGIGGANYGTSGQVLTSNGNNSSVSWATPNGGSDVSLTNYSDALFGNVEISNNLTVSGDTTLNSNVDISGDLDITGTVTATSYIGDGSLLTGLSVVSDVSLTNYSDASFGNMDVSGELKIGNYILPTTMGSDGEVLTVPSSGNTLEWTNGGGGGGGGSTNINISSSIIADLSLNQFLKPSATANVTTTSISDTYVETPTFYAWDVSLNGDISYNSGVDGVGSDDTFYVTNPGEYSINILLRTPSKFSDNHYVDMIDNIGSQHTERVQAYGFIRAYNTNSSYHDYILQGYYYRDDGDQYDSLIIGGQVRLYFTENMYFKIGIIITDTHTAGSALWLSRALSYMRIEKYTYTLS